MGHGNNTRGDEFTFHCSEGHRIVGYKGTASSHVDRISFITRKF